MDCTPDSLEHDLFEKIIINAGKNTIKVLLLNDDSCFSANWTTIFEKIMLENKLQIITKINLLSELASTCSKYKTLNFNPNSKHVQYILHISDDVDINNSYYKIIVGKQKSLVNKLITDYHIKYNLSENMSTENDFNQLVSGFSNMSPGQ